jgi:hypothetical protein
MAVLTAPLIPGSPDAPTAVAEMIGTISPTSPVAYGPSSQILQTPLIPLAAGGGGPVGYPF